MGEITEVAEQQLEEPGPTGPGTTATNPPGRGTRNHGR